MRKGETDRQQDKHAQADGKERKTSEVVGEAEAARE